MGFRRVRKQKNADTRRLCDVCRLTKRWSQPLAVAMRPFDFMKQLSEFATLAPASGG
jgi:hypothetical protein